MLTLVEGMLLLYLVTLAAAENVAVEKAHVERAGCMGVKREERSGFY